MLQSSIADAETYRDSLLVLLEDTNTSNDELESMIETANNSILVLQSDLVVQQDLVVQWQQTAEDNRANLDEAILSEANLTNADLSGADLTGVYWYSTTCPDGTNSDDNGNTCENNL